MMGHVSFACHRVKKVTNVSHTGRLQLVYMQEPWVVDIDKEDRQTTTGELERVSSHLPR